MYVIRSATGNLRIEFLRDTKDAHVLRFVRTDKYVAVALDNHYESVIEWVRPV